MKAKILIVDDNEKNVELLSDFIESWGYEVIIAYQGKEAMKLVEEKKPDLVVLDVMLPGSSGFEICKNLRSNSDTWYLPVILVTALDGIDDKLNGYNSGADGFLVKPVIYKELKAMIKNLLKKGKLMKRSEPEQLVLDKIYVVLQKVLGDKIMVQQGEYKDFFFQVFKHLKLEEELVYQVWNTVRYYPAYKALIEKKGDDEFIRELFVGFRCEKWLIPLLSFVYRLRVNKDYDLPTSPKPLGERKVLCVCTVLTKLLDFLNEEDKDVNKALKRIEAEETACIFEGDVKKAIRREVDNREMRKNMAMHLENMLK